jgi:hypothetical protein
MAGFVISITSVAAATALMVVFGTMAAWLLRL